jgi:ABC-type transporter lipoprotein component MlaA
MVNSNLGKHCVVLNLGLAQWGAIVGDYYQLPCISPTNKNQSPIFKILSKKSLKKKNTTKSKEQKTNQQHFTQ